MMPVVRRRDLEEMSTVELIELLLRGRRASRRYREPLMPSRQARLAQERSMPVSARRPADQNTFSANVAEAVRAGQITPVFQPIVSLRTRSVVGFEVLARWHDPLLGKLSPAVFIPALEAAGMLDDTTALLMQRSFAAAAGLSEEFFLAFNISPTQLEHSRLLKLIQGAAKAGAFPLNRLFIEITETALITDYLQAKRVLEQLRSVDIGIAFDDFGTGYSSLSWLQQLPFTELKLDTSFVRSMLEDRQSRKIVGAIVGLGQNLGLPVVAEGVETEEQARCLDRLGCDLAQGFLFGRGEPAEKLPDLLRSFKKQTAAASVPALSLDRRTAQIESLYRSSPVSIAFISPDLRVASASDAFAQRMGVSSHDLIGHAAADVLPSVAPHLDSLHRGGQVGDLNPTFKLDMPAGGTDLFAMHRVYDEAEEFLGYSVVGIDITEWKKLEAAMQASEEHYRHTVDLSPHLHWTADSFGRFVYVSPRTPVMAQISKMDAIQNFGWLDFIDPAQRESARGAWMHSISTGAVYDIKLHLLMKDGTYRWHRAYAAPRRADDGQILLWYGTTTDIDQENSASRF